MEARSKLAHAYKVVHHSTPFMARLCLNDPFLLGLTRKIPSTIRRAYLVHALSFITATSFCFIVCFSVTTVLHPFILLLDTIFQYGLVIYSATRCLTCSNPHEEELLYILHHGLPGAFYISIQLLLYDEFRQHSIRVLFHHLDVSIAVLSEMGVAARTLTIMAFPPRKLKTLCSLFLKLDITAKLPRNVLVLLNRGNL
jgi:hypothetical protein